MEYYTSLLIFQVDTFMNVDTCYDEVPSVCFDDCLIFTYSFTQWNLDKGPLDGCPCG